MRTEPLGKVKPLRTATAGHWDEGTGRPCSHRNTKQCDDGSFGRVVRVVTLFPGFGVAAAGAKTVVLNWVVCPGSNGYTIPPDPS